MPQMLSEIFLYQIALDYLKNVLSVKIMYKILVTILPIEKCCYSKKWSSNKIQYS